MSNEKKSHNIVNGIDDMEYVEMFKLDPSIAYTPEINDAILDKVWEENYSSALADGLTEEEAKSEADTQRKSGRMTVDNYLKNKK
jgi:hypothetical protein